MNAASDHQLLRAYATRRDEAAFRELVQRHTDFIYSAALRQVNSDAVARDLTQSVFTDLARRAPDILGKHTGDSLAGWLHRATRYAALNHLRDARRRHDNERQAMEQLLTNSDPAADWQQIRPALDEALDALDDTDREALLLRYFKNHDFRTVGAQLGVSDDAAQKRVSRAVERLREFFAKRGVSVGAGGLVVVISANAVQAAPVGLAVTISAAALAGTAATTSTLIAATTKTIAMTTLQKTLVTATVAVLAGAGIYEARQAAQLRAQVQTLQQQQAPLAEQLQQLQSEQDQATNKLAGLLAENSRLKSNPNQSEILKLRGEVGVLSQTLATLSNQLDRASTPYRLKPEQVPPVINSGVPDTAKSYARLARKLSKGQLSPAEEFNLLKAWPYLGVRFSEPNSFAYFQSEYLASMLDIKDKGMIWEIRRLLENAREEEHAHGLPWARESDEDLQHYADLNLDIQKIRGQWNSINQRTTQQIWELLSKDQQAKLGAMSWQILDFDPQLKSGTQESLNEPRFQNLSPQEIFEAFSPPNQNVRVVPATLVEKKQ